MRWIRVAGALGGLALTAAACGGAAKAGSGSASLSAEDQQVAFARCMQEHGVEADVSGDVAKFAIKIAPGGGAAGKGGEGEDDEVSQAMEACKDKMPKRGADLSPEERAKLEDALVEFTKCMRENGIDMPDPGEGGIVRVQKGAGSARAGLDPESEEFQAAEKACEDKLPNKGGRNKVTLEAP